jgi:hypothetical protein
MTVALPATGDCPAPSPGLLGHHRRVVLQRAVDQQVGPPALRQRCGRLLDLLHILPLPRHASANTTASPPAAECRRLRPCRRSGWRCRPAARRSGSVTTAQSPKTSTCSGRHMKNTLDTSSQPGTVLISCNAGRMVLRGGVHRTRTPGHRPRPAPASSCPAPPRRAAPPRPAPPSAPCSGAAPPSPRYSAGWISVGSMISISGGMHHPAPALTAGACVRQSPSNTQRAMPR